MDNTFIPKNQKEAWIGILFSCMTSDTFLPEKETETLAHMLLIKEMFKTSEVLTIYRDCMMAHSRLGSKGLMELCFPLIEQSNRATLFAMAVDLLLIDGTLQAGEVEVLDYLSSGLSMQETLKNQIIDTMLIKNKQIMLA